MIVDSFFQALKSGNELASAETWKKSQQLVNAVSSLLASLVVISSEFGYRVPLDQEQIGALAGAVLPAVIVFNWIATAVSSKRSGLLPRRKSRSRNGA